MKYYFCHGGTFRLEGVYNTMHYENVARGFLKDSGNKVRLLEDYFSGLMFANY